jgi:hypothetical protein
VNRDPRFDVLFEPVKIGPVVAPVPSPLPCTPAIGTRVSSTARRPTLRQFSANCRTPIRDDFRHARRNFVTCSDYAITLL